MYERLGERVGSTPLERASNADPRVSLGGGLSDEATWQSNFPTYSGTRLTRNGVYDPSGDPAHIAASRVPQSVWQAQYNANRMYPQTRQGFDQRGLLANGSYDPAHDMRTQRQNNEIINPYGTASVRPATNPQQGVASVAPADPMATPVQVPAWHKFIMDQYPEIGQAGSEANKQFVSAYTSALKQGPVNDPVGLAHSVMSSRAIVGAPAPAPGRSGSSTALNAYEPDVPAPIPAPAPPQGGVTSNAPVRAGVNGTTSTLALNAPKFNRREQSITPY